MLALGAVVATPARVLERTEFPCGILDFYDHWSEIDPRPAAHHARLSEASEAFGHDLVDLATYTHEVLHWLEPTRIREAPSVVVVGAMVQAFVVSLRSACDAAASALSYVASEKPGQVPSTSMRALLTWAGKNPGRLRPAVAELLSSDFTWFWQMRSIRDYLVHGGCSATIHCDGRQFNLWVFSPRNGWVSRSALLPLLRDQLVALLRLGNCASDIVMKELAIPEDRRGSRVVAGVLVPALHTLLEVADQYAAPSP